MKNISGFTSLLSALILFTLAGCVTAADKTMTPEEWVAESKVGQRLPLGRMAHEWSEPKTFTVKSGTLEVKSQFTQHHGSTCHYDVQFTNVGKTPIIATAVLSNPDKLAIYNHNSGKINLSPGKYITYKDLENRECAVIFETSEAMDACASCKPWIQFAD